MNFKQEATLSLWFLRNIGWLHKQTRLKPHGWSVCASRAFQMKGWLLINAVNVALAQLALTLKLNLLRDVSKVTPFVNVWPVNHRESILIFFLNCSLCCLWHRSLHSSISLSTCWDHSSSSVLLLLRMVSCCLRNSQAIFRFKCIRCGFLVGVSLKTLNLFV